MAAIIVAGVDKLDLPRCLARWLKRQRQPHLTGDIGPLAETSQASQTVLYAPDSQLVISSTCHPSAQ